jgi:hypothetical protein
MAKANSTGAPAPRKTSKRARTKLAPRDADELFGEKMYRQIMRQPAFLKESDVDRLERTAQFRDWVRRAMGRFLAMSGKQTIQRCRKDRDFAVALAIMSEHTGPYKDNLKQLMGFVDALDGRMLIALACREDMTEIISEAKGGGDGPPLTPENAEQLLAAHAAKGGRA